VHTRVEHGDDVMTGFRVLVVIRVFSTVIVLVIIIIIIHGSGPFGFYFIIISNCVSF